MFKRKSIFKEWQQIYLCIERTILLTYKDLISYISENNFIGPSNQNNYVGHSSDDNATKNFVNLITNLNVPHNYFDDSRKLFLDLYLARFLNIFKYFSEAVFSMYIYIYIYTYSEENFSFFLGTTLRFLNFPTFCRKRFI